MNSNSDPQLSHTKRRRQISPPPQTSNIPKLPFQILYSTPHNVPPAATPLETLPHGFFSKSASFSKLQRKVSLNFESQKESSVADDVAVKLNPVKKSNNKVYPNLVTVTEPSPNFAFRKSNIKNEGNFVKINTNLKYKKFKKGKRNSYNYAARSSYRRGYRRSKRKLKSEEEENACEEDGLVAEIVGEKRRNVGNNGIEEAIFAAREDFCDENLVKLLNLVYGYDSFRQGQLEAIKLVFRGESAMLVLPTGAGKSLCYQIPALVLEGITLVVSPLVALMIDQLKQLPWCIQGGVLCSNQKPQEAAETIRLVQEGTIKVLFVSPERFLNAEFLSIISAITISLLVVDEAHCISEWSHNFRPSYMRLRASFLKNKLRVGRILAMTATATITTLNAIMSVLEIPSSNLIQMAHLKDNLQLSVSLSGNNKMKDLLALIKSPPYTDIQSIIIYCKFQYESDTISKYLCDNSISAKSYHSAIPAKDRSRTQELFCSNKIRVVVATVAFGMGLDKSDVGAVIHYSLPESLEEYVQEIGRSGRDGRLSYCHLFYDDNIYYKIRSLMHSDGVDEYAVNKFLCQVFSNNVKSRGRVFSIIKESASRKFDMKEEVMLTLFTQLEMGEVKYLRLLPEQNVTCTLNFYKTSPVLLADKDIVISAILKSGETARGQYVFDIPTVANSVGVSTIDLSNHLQNLKLKGEINYEVKDPAYCYTIVEDPVDFCALSAHLTKWLSEVECCKIQKLDAMFDAVYHAVNECNKMQGCEDTQHTPCLQRKILDYFKEDNKHNIPQKMVQSSPFLRADIKVFLQSNSQAKFTPRAIARIMHGIGSPAYPTAIWSKTHFWGRYMQIDFQAIMEAAKAELMNVAGKDVL